MSKYKYSEKTFVNPFHFVPLGKQCSREHKEYKDRKGNLTGWIDCRIQTLSHIFIPNTSSVTEKNGEKHSDIFQKRVFKEKDNKEVVINSYDFFSYTDLSTLEGDALTAAKEPVLPGSEIRGVIRSAFEAVTNSCLSTIDDEQVLYKRVTSTGKPGILIFDNGKWIIQPCERIGIKTVDLKNNIKKSNGRIIYNGSKIQNFDTTIQNWSEGQPVSVEITVDFYPKVIKKRGKPDQVIKLFQEIISINKGHDSSYNSIFDSTHKRFNGYLHKGEGFGTKKHHESVFVPTNENKIEIDEIAVRNYVNNLKLYKDKTINLHLRKKEHSGYEHTEVKNKELREFNKSLIYFTERDGKYYLSPAAIGREVFYNKLNEGKIIGDYKPCDRIDELCPACSLFGIAGKNGSAAASRLRFTDAHIENKKENPTDYYDKDRILKELASPKPSAAEFYLVQNPKEAHLWNYDYAILNPYNPQIRGRKFYWHHENPDPYIPVEKENDKETVSNRNVAVRPLKRDTTFTFKIYFDEITDDELKKLLWVLTIGNKKENGHKIGMGKPLGLGSVKITLSKVNFREISLQNGTIKYEIQDKLSDFSDFTSMDSHSLGCGPKIWNDFLQITNLNNGLKPIEYPNIEDDPKNYLWFMANKQIDRHDGIGEKKGKGGTGTNPIIEQVLPPMNKPALNKYKKK